MTRLPGILTRHSATLFLTLLLAGFSFSSAHAGAYSQSFTVANRATVHIVTNDGSVRVTPSDAKQVEIHVEYRGYVEGKTVHFDSHQTGDAVEFTARAATIWPLSLGSYELHIEVRLPKDGDLKVETSDGEIHASGLAGNIDLSSGDGELNVSALSGVLRLHTGDGAIEGRDLDGQCDAASGDGSIKLAGRFEVLKVKSGDGEIDIKAVHGSVMKSSWSVESGDGGIEVALPADLAASIDASTGDGHISTDMPITVSGRMNKTRVQGTLNGGGQSVTIRTGDGDVRLGQS